MPQMVGRDDELDQLKEHLRASINERGNLVLVSGEAGIGKTRLVKELEAYAETLGVKVLEGCCLIESPISFLPFREALKNIFTISRDDTPTVQQRKINKIVKESAPEFVKAIPIVGQILAGSAIAYRTYKEERDREKRVDFKALFERDAGLETISDLLIAISARQPLLIFIDDLHLADTSSLSLLYYLARRIQSSRILIVGTYRPEEIAKTREGTIHPLLDVMQRMSREDLFKKIELKRLSITNCLDFIKSMLDVNFDDLAKLIHEETEGNPFFAIETLRLLIQQKVLIKEKARWKLSMHIEDIKIPPRMYDVIIHRINALMDEERDILDCASVVGEEFSSDVVGNVLGVGRIELLKSLNNIERRYHLIHSADHNFHFDHVKIKEVLYNEIAMDLKKEYHSMIAKYIEETNKDLVEEVVNDLAYHYYKSGNALKGVPYLLKAGENAREKWAVFEAVRYSSQALEMMRDDERWGEDRTKALEALGNVYALTDQHEKANECFEKGIANTKDTVARERIYRKIRRKRIFEKNRVKIAYYMYGEGEPTLVFVVAWIWTAALWIPQVNYFSQKFKIVTIDMRGAGESDKPPDNYTLDLYADDLNSIIEELHDKDIVLIGESMGASIAITYVTKYPGKVSKLVLLSGGPKMVATTDFPYGFSKNDYDYGIALAMNSYPNFVKFTMGLFFSEPGTEYLKEWGFKQSQESTPDIAINSLRNLFEADLRPLLSKITIPTLIINGEIDKVVRWENAMYMHGNIPGSEMHVFNDKGHFPSITAADRFNKILDEFIITDNFSKD